MTTTDDNAWTAQFWNAVHAFVAACGGTVDMRYDQEHAAEKIDAVRRIRDIIEDRPAIDAQLRADVRTYRADAATARMVAYQLVEIAEFCASGSLTPERQEAARAALARTVEVLGLKPRAEGEPDGR